jgi:hypothetical protein
VDWRLGWQTFQNTTLSQPNHFTCNWAFSVWIRKLAYGCILVCTNSRKGSKTTGLSMPAIPRAVQIWPSIPRVFSLLPSRCSTSHRRQNIHPSHRYRPKPSVQASEILAKNALIKKTVGTHNTPFFLTNVIIIRMEIGCLAPRVLASFMFYFGHTFSFVVCDFQWYPCRVPWVARLALISITVVVNVSQEKRGERKAANVTL